MVISVRDELVEVKKSKIHGKGVFSKDKIKKGDVIGLIMEKTKEAKDPDKSYSRTNIGEHLNHSNTPNAKAILTKKGYALAARQDIPANTEILVDYEQFQELSGVPQRIPLSKRAAEYVEKKKEESGNITYIYTEKHVAERDKKKAEKVAKMGKDIERVRKQVSSDLKSSDIDTKYSALAVALIDDTYERVGNRYSAEDLNHYGVTTWLKKHIKFTGGTAVISYTGKSGVKQTKKITNKKIIPPLREMISGKKDSDIIFKGDDYYITDNVVNKYLKKFDITAKDIRGFHANEEMRKELKKVRKGTLPKEQKEKEKKLKEEFKEALESTSKIVGHEAGTLKSQYLIPGLETSFLASGKIASESFHISKRAALAEEEVQRLLLKILPGTPFASKAFSVGGYERDKLMGMESKDLDIVVEIQGGAEALAKFIANSFPEQTSAPRQLGAAYPIWHVAFKEDITYEGEQYATRGAEIDIADTQKEYYPDPASRQRETVYAPLKDDIERRDFTVNMLLRDLTSGEIQDLTGVSKEDIEEGILRAHPAVEPDTMFSNDPLRMLRLIRFQCKYGWKVPLSMLKSVRRNAEEIQKISWERVQEELVKIMKLGETAQAIKIMKATNLLPFVLPEIYGLVGVKHDKRSHDEGDVYKHTLLVLSNAPPTIHGQLAALLHDVGKPATQQFIGDKIQFLGHEKTGAEMAEAILRRLKFDNKTIERVKSMVENHMRPHSLEHASPKALRKFVRDVGEGMVDDVLDLAEADTLGNMPPSNYIPELRKRMEKAKEIPVTKKPVLNGKEIMDLLNVKPGPIIGQVGKYLLELQDELAEEGKELTKDVAKRMVVKKFASFLLSKREQ